MKVDDAGKASIEGHLVPTPAPAPTTIEGTFHFNNEWYAYGWREGEPAPFILSTGVGK
jgi:hypothetical protein